MKKEIYIERVYSLTAVSEKQLANLLGRSFMFGVIDNVIMVRDQFYLTLKRVGKNNPLFLNRGYCLPLCMIEIRTCKNITQISFFFSYSRIWISVSSWDQEMTQEMASDKLLSSKQSAKGVQKGKYLILIGWGQKDNHGRLALPWAVKRCVSYHSSIMSVLLIVHVKPFAQLPFILLPSKLSIL